MSWRGSSSPQAPITCQQQFQDLRVTFRRKVKLEQMVDLAPALARSAGGRRSSGGGRVKGHRRVKIPAEALLRSRQHNSASFLDVDCANG